MNALLPLYPPFDKSKMSYILSIWYLFLAINFIYN